MPTALENAAFSVIPLSGNKMVVLEERQRGLSIGTCGKARKEAKMIDIKQAIGKYRCDKCIFRSDRTKYCKVTSKKVEGHMICDAFRKRKEKTWLS